MKTPFAAAACAAAALAALLATAPAHAATYAIDPTHTFVTFEVSHFGTSTHRGRFDRKEGSVTFDRAARTGTVDITIDTASISTGVAPLNTRLQSKDFLNTEAHPTARFVGERLVFNGDRVSEVAGSLTMLGKTLPVTLKATHFNCYDNPIFKREVCGGDFETTLLRSQWGMNAGIELGIPDNVRLLIQVEAIQQ